MSIWEKDFNTFKRKQLIENRKVNTVVIGGGIAGILTAYKLKNSGVDVILLEKNRILSGVTKNTTAKITSQHNLIYNEIINTLGTEKAQMYLKANENAILKYRKMCENIDCDFENKNSYVYTLNNPKLIENEINALNKIGYKANFVKDTKLPFKIKGAVEFENQAQFNPLKFLREIAKNIEIYENSHAIIKDLHTIKVNNIEIKCENIVFATHFPFLDRYGMYFAKMYQERSYVVALKNGSDVCGMYIDENKNGLSFRNYKNFLFVGGGNHRTGKQGGGYSELLNLYPKCEVAYKWATQDCITLDKIPYIGKYSVKTPNMYVISGFNKWGMTNAMAGSDVICDLILGKQNEFTDLYNPNRFSLNKQFFVNGGETLKGLLGVSKKRCSHLGCRLIYNKEEKSWDCPCHGSRFSEKGKVIENPANKDTKI